MLLKLMTVVSLSLLILKPTTSATEIQFSTDYKMNCYTTEEQEAEPTFQAKAEAMKEIYAEDDGTGQMDFANFDYSRDNLGILVFEDNLNIDGEIKVVEGQVNQEKDKRKAARFIMMKELHNDKDILPKIDTILCELSTNGEYFRLLIFEEAYVTNFFIDEDDFSGDNLRGDHMGHANQRLEVYQGILELFKRINDAGLKACNLRPSNLVFLETDDYPAPRIDHAEFIVKKNENCLDNKLNTVKDLDMHYSQMNDAANIVGDQYQTSELFGVAILMITLEIRMYQNLITTGYVNLKDDFEAVYEDDYRLVADGVIDMADEDLAFGDDAQASWQDIIDSLFAYNKNLVLKREADDVNDDMESLFQQIKKSAEFFANYSSKFNHDLYVDMEDSLPEWNVGDHDKAVEVTNVEVHNQQTDDKEEIEEVDDKEFHQSERVVMIDEGYKIFTDMLSGLVNLTYQTDAFTLAVAEIVKARAKVNYAYDTNNWEDNGNRRLLMI